MASITINGITVDPLVQRAGLAAAQLEAADASRSDYVLIQTRQPLDKIQKAELANNGVTILEYVPDQTYLCYYKPADLTLIRNLPYVAWAHIYLRAFKVAPSLHALPPGPRVRSVLEMAAQPEQRLSQRPALVDVVFHANVDPESLRTAIAAAAHLDQVDLKLARHKVRLTVPARYLPALAAIDGVRHIEAVTPKKLHNNVARGILGVYSAGNPTIPYQGDGQLVAVADTGFDRGSTSDVHPAFTGRVLKLYPLGRPGKANDPDGHGTHVAGSVLGDGASASLGSIRGTAPKAQLVFQSVLDSQGGLGGLPDDLHDLFLPPYQNDQARIHTNSWGSQVGDGSYDQNANEIDDFVWTHRDCVICFAAGNEGRDSHAVGRINPMSVTPPATAKNCITVGATENNRPTFPLTYGQGWPSDFPANPIASDKVADNADGMAAFSSRGPTQDQRVKPDVVAPGTYILSTLSRDVVVPPTPGWDGSADPLYFFDGGTSMATPLVAGCVALVREYLAKKRGISNPSAALVKAMLINGATAIPGQYVPTETGSIPNGADGFGRVNVPATLVDGLTLKDEGTALDTNDAEVTKVTVAAGATLKVTLVWTDPAGDALQNDLDLIVTAADGQERHGNVDASSTSFDRINNVEQVVWPLVAAGDVSITVRAFRIAASRQSYALVVRLA